MVCSFVRRSLCCFLPHYIRMRRLKFSWRLRLLPPPVLLDGLGGAAFSSWLGFPIKAMPVSTVFSVRLLTLFPARAIVGTSGPVTRLEASWPACLSCVSLGQNGYPYGVGRTFVRAWWQSKGWCPGWWCPWVPWDHKTGKWPDHSLLGWEATQDA